MTWENAKKNKQVLPNYGNFSLLCEKWLVKIQNSAITFEFLCKNTSYPEKILL